MAAMKQRLCDNPDCNMCRPRSGALPLNSEPCWMADADCPCMDPHNPDGWAHKSAYRTVRRGEA